VSGFRSVRAKARLGENSVPPRWDYFLPSPKIQCKENFFLDIEFETIIYNYETIEQYNFSKLKKGFTGKELMGQTPGGR
jgi:hypothetical protein